MLIFLCPTLMDALVFLVLFAVSYGAGERGLTLTQCAWLGGVFQIAYMANSLVSGFTLSRRNARTLLAASIAGSVLVAAFALVARGFWPVFAGLAVFGRGTLAWWTRQMAFRRLSIGALSTAEQWLAWSAWFDPSDGRTDLLRAACLRRQYQQDAWNEAIQANCKNRGGAGYVEHHARVNHRSAQHPCRLIATAGRNGCPLSETRCARCLLGNIPDNLPWVHNARQLLLIQAELRAQLLGPDAALRIAEGRKMDEGVINKCLLAL